MTDCGSGHKSLLSSDHYHVFGCVLNEGNAKYPVSINVKNVTQNHVAQLCSNP